MSLPDFYSTSIILRGCCAAGRECSRGARRRDAGVAVGVGGAAGARAHQSAVASGSDPPHCSLGLADVGGPGTSAACQPAAHCRAVSAATAGCPSPRRSDLRSQPGTDGPGGRGRLRGWYCGWRRLRACCKATTRRRGSPRQRAATCLAPAMAEGEEASRAAMTAHPSRHRSRTSRGWCSASKGAEHAEPGHKEEAWATSVAAKAAHARGAARARGVAAAVQAAGRETGPAASAARTRALHARPLATAARRREAVVAAVQAGQRQQRAGYRGPATREDISDQSALMDRVRCWGAEMKAQHRVAQAQSWALMLAMDAVLHGSRMVTRRRGRKCMQRRSTKKAFARCQAGAARATRRWLRRRRPGQTAGRVAGPSRIKTHGLHSPRRKMTKTLATWRKRTSVRDLGRKKRELTELAAAGRGREKTRPLATRMNKRSGASGRRCATWSENWNTIEWCRRSCWRRREIREMQQNEDGEQPNSPTRCRSGSGGQRPSCGMRNPERKRTVANWPTILPRRPGGQPNWKRGSRWIQRERPGSGRPSRSCTAKEGSPVARARKKAARIAVAEIRDLAPSITAVINHMGGAEAPVEEMRKELQAVAAMLGHVESVLQEATKEAVDQRGPAQFDISSGTAGSSDGRGGDERCGDDDGTEGGGGGKTTQSAQAQRWVKPNASAPWKRLAVTAADAVERARQVLRRREEEAMAEGAGDRTGIAEEARVTVGSGATTNDLAEAERRERARAEQQIQLAMQQQQHQPSPQQMQQEEQARMQREQRQREEMAKHQEAMQRAATERAMQEAREREELIAKLSPADLARAAEVHAQQAAVAAHTFGTAAANHMAGLVHQAHAHQVAQATVGADMETEEVNRLMAMSPEELAQHDREMQERGGYW